MTELGLFARHWTPGDVKTRLAAAIGPEAAATVYRASLMLTVARFANIAQRRVIVFTPVRSAQGFTALAATRWQTKAQADGDLGARMAHYFADALATGSSRVVLIGSDSPTLPISYVEQAFVALQQSPVVLGPASDGGYYLIGMSRPIPELFHQIAWSTSAVWQQTIDCLRRLEVAYTTLPQWHDFDDVDDLRRLQAELQLLSTHSPEFLPLQAAIDDALSGIAS